MVHCIDVSDMELASLKLLVVLNLVEVGRKVRVGALLLERAAYVLKMVCIMVNLLSPSPVIGIKCEAVHIFGLDLTGAIGILVVSIITKLAEVACKAFLAVAHMALCVELTKAITL